MSCIHTISTSQPATSGLPLQGYSPMGGWSGRRPDRVPRMQHRGPCVYWQGDASGFRRLREAAQAEPEAECAKAEQRDDGDDKPLGGIGDYAPENQQAGDDAEDGRVAYPRVVVDIPPARLWRVASPENEQANSRQQEIRVFGNPCP